MAFSERRALKFKGWPVIALSYGSNLDMGDIDPATFPPFFQSHNQYESNSETYREGFYIYNLEKVLEDPEAFWTVAYDAPFLHFPNKDNKALPDPAETSRLREINKSTSQIKEKHQYAFWIDLALGFKIERARRDGEDVLLDMYVKYRKDIDGPGSKHLRLEKCTLCEFRDGSEDGDLLARTKPFSVARGQMDEKRRILWCL